MIKTHSSLYFMLAAFALRGSAADYKVLYQFPAPDGSDGLIGPLVPGPVGTYYGVATVGGAYGYGTIFSFQPGSGGAPSVLTTLHSFEYAEENPGSVYSNPVPIIVGPGGAIYGANAVLGGSIFALVPPTDAGGEWTYYTAYVFNTAPFTSCILRAGAFGNLYGIAGGFNGVAYTYLFQLTLPSQVGERGTLVQMATFSEYSPSALLIGEGGTMFVASNTLNGPNVVESIFEFVPPATEQGTWVSKTIYSFASGPYFPFAPVPAVIARDGTVYLTGSNPDTFTFEVSALTPPASGSSGWTFSSIYNSSNLDQGNNLTALAIDANGVLYSVGNYAGPGPVFSLSNHQGTWVYKPLTQIIDYATPLTVTAPGQILGATESAGVIYSASE